MHISLLSWIIIGIVTVLCVTLFVVLKVRKNRRAQAEYERPLREWLDQVQGVSTLAEQVALGQPPVLDKHSRHHVPQDLYRNSQSVYEEVKTRQAVENKLIAKKQMLERAGQLVATLQVNQCILSEAWVLKRLNRFFEVDGWHLKDDTSADITWLRERHAASAEAWANEQLLAARDLDREAFGALRAFVVSSRYRDESEYERITGHRYRYPARWNQLMIQFVRNPYLSDFVNVNDLAPGRVSLIAAKALREQSLIRGLLVRAYCRDSEYRREVGDVLFADITKMVEQLQSAGRFAFS